jgi:hypothetical protein
MPPVILKLAWYSSCKTLGSIATVRTQRPQPRAILYRLANFDIAPTTTPNMGLIRLAETLPFPLPKIRTTRLIYTIGPLSRFRFSTNIYFIAQLMPSSTALVLSIAPDPAHHDAVLLPDLVRCMHFS